MNALNRVRYMRLLVFFDLPVETAKQRKAYRLFRRYLIKEGYLMLQESVYAKLVVNEASGGAAIERMRKNRPKEGLVQVLKVTEKQYESMIFITGERGEFEEVNTMDEFVII